MVVKVKEKIEKTRHVENNDNSNKYILPGERSVRYLDKILSNKKNLRIQHNCIDSILFLIQHNFIILQLSSVQSVQRGI